MKPFISRYTNYSPIVLTCEHASRTIPAKYKNLGLTRQELIQSKDWNDPGALWLMQALAKRLKASSLVYKFSRLVIDANRRLDNGYNPKNTFHSAALKQHLLVEFPEGEQLIDIPANQVKNLKQEEFRRWKRYVGPYYREGCRLANQTRKQQGRAFVVQIHSFYPMYNGSSRRVDIDVLHSHRTVIAHELIGYLRASCSYIIGDNEPWGLDDTVGGGVFAPLMKESGTAVVGFDVNNKNLTTRDRAERVAKILAKALDVIVVKGSWRGHA